MSNSIDDINLDNITLGTPYTIQGGAYFSKIKIDGSSLVIQTPTSKTKNGIKKTGKRMYCDLMFNLDDQEYYEWYEKLEEKVKQLIFNNKKEWFHEDITLEEIEYNWNTVLRSYKSKFYLLRTLIDKSKIINDYDLQIWNENKELLNLEDFKSDSKIISIVEIKGLKFTSQSFSLDCVLKQIMVLKENKQPNICLIKRKGKDLENTNEVLVNKVEKHKINEGKKEKSNKELHKEEEPVEEEPVEEEHVEEEHVEEEQMQLKEEPIEEEEPKEEEPKEEDEQLSEKDEQLSEKDEQLSEKDEQLGEKKDLEKVKKTDITEGSLEKGKDLEKKDMIEINLELPEDLEKNTMRLKKPNEVYYEMYENAKKKAKLAKKLAIQSYLESKQIKKTYLLDFCNELEEYIDNDLEKIIKGVKNNVNSQI